jgi:hypothetical protein
LSIIMLSDKMLSDKMLTVIMLSFVILHDKMLSDNMLSVITLSVIMLSVVVPHKCHQKYLGKWASLLRNQTHVQIGLKKATFPDVQITDIYIP